MTDLANQMPPAASIVSKLSFGAFFLIIGVGVGANVLAGTDWDAIRREWDRFVDAFWRENDGPECTRSNRGQSGLSAHEIGKQAKHEGGVREPLVDHPQLPDGSKSPLSGAQMVPHVGDGLRRNPRRNAQIRRAYTVFDVVEFKSGRIVTGHQYPAMSDGTRPARTYCYGEPLEPTAGVRQQVNLAMREGSGSAVYHALSESQAALFGLDAAGLGARARTDCQMRPPGSSGFGPVRDAISKVIE